MGKIVVFLDTNEYKRCGHNFNSTPMRKILELTSKGTIHLLSTTVVVGEVTNHIKEEVKSFVSDQRKLARNAGSIQNLPDFNEMIKKIDVDDTTSKAVQSFNDFLSSANCEIIASNGINVDDILIDYFKKILPFEDNTKKGDEFKDSFIIYVLRSYADEMNVVINVVSDDKGLCGALSGDKKFRTFSRSEDLFKYITKVAEEISALNAKIVQQYLNNLAVKQSIQERIENVISYAGVWIDDAYECEIEEIISAEVDDFSLTYLDDAVENVISAHIDANVTLVVDYTRVDEENSFWDKEEGRYLFKETEYCRLTKQINCDFIMSLNIEADENGQIIEIIEIDDFNIENARSGICIGISDDDDIEVLDYSSSSYDDDYVPDAYTTCPDCGCKINHENDGGNGFCIKCAYKH
ncbi:MAG: PIN domain-containing protein [Defluviitaleaceae bacterium]|nr:PIN domain-containing protein [Defluviitaleaceae bacterium]